VFRTLLCCAVFALYPLRLQAEPAVTPTETVIRLTVRPMAAPKPALRYLLLPELREMTPGNPIPNYLKCMLEKDSSPDRQTIGKAALRQADRAARMDRPDWQILLRIKTDGVGLLIPDVQKLRELSTALQGRFRDEIAQGRIEDAIETAKTLFALSRHLGEHPTLIGNLVGIAIAFVTIGPLEELLEQPGCPNLYWALTNLPRPLVPLSKGLEGERILVLAELRDLDDRSPMSQDQIKKLLAHLDILAGIAGSSRNKFRAWLDERTGNEKLVRSARRRLVERGLRDEKVRRFPAAQVILLDEKFAYEVQRDEVMKLVCLPAWQAEPLLAEIKPDRDASRLFSFLLPSLQKIYRAQGRLEQRMALLRHVEALRLYAAEHGGKWPEKLTDVPVPLPPDPFTGKPFRYQVHGDTAQLRGIPPPGEEKNPAYNIRYEITIRK
jgi:hypothetical protein